MKDTAAFAIKSANYALKIIQCAMSASMAIFLINKGIALFVKWKIVKYAKQKLINVINALKIMA